MTQMNTKFWEMIESRQKNGSGTGLSTHTRLAEKRRDRTFPRSDVACSWQAPQREGESLESAHGSVLSRGGWIAPPLGRMRGLPRLASWRVAQTAWREHPRAGRLPAPDAAAVEALSELFQHWIRVHRDDVLGA